MSLQFHLVTSSLTMCFSSAVRKKSALLLPPTASQG